jgi:ABC-type multidrug transport system fused ATPase/permease subunit
LVLDNGHLVEFGPPALLKLKKHGHFNRMLDGVRKQGALEIAAKQSEL